MRWIRGPFHRYWRDVIETLQESGLWTDALEILHSMIMSHGPWASKGWWHETTECMEDRSQNNGPENPVSPALCPELWRDMLNDPKVTRVPQPDTPEAYRSVW